eukprot:15608922-Heterocapsa_arctica.AAC.1
MKENKAIAMGVTRDDWYGNQMANEKAKEGSEMHGYTRNQKRRIRDNEGPEAYHEDLHRLHQ